MHSANHPKQEVQLTRTKRKTAKATATKTTLRAEAPTPISRESGTRTRRQSDNDKHDAASTTAGGRQTKQAAILGLLQRPLGASIADLTEATQWQAHSVRAALTGLRKKGHAIVRANDDSGVTRYRIDEGQ